MAGPRLSLTAANADEWIPVRPGHDLDLALALSSVILERGLEDSGFTASRAAELDRFREFLTVNAKPQEIAERIGVPLARIERIALELASHRPSAVLAGYARAGDARSPALALAVSHLNALLGAYSDEGLLRAGEPDEETAEELSLAAEIRAGKALPRVLFVDDTNPVHSLPPSLGLEEALSQSFLVSFASFPDETMERASIVLPESMSFERFDDAVPEHGSYARLSGPLLLRPIYDTRSMPDSLIALARKMERVDALPWESYEQALREAWAPRGSWDEILAAGGQAQSALAPVAFTTPDGRYRFATERIESALGAPLAAGRALHVYASTAFGEGRGARLPYLQDLADPVTGVRWGSVLEIAEKDAVELGIRTGDTVELGAGSSMVTLPAFVSPGIVPGVVALAAGQGHTANGRHGSGRGVNAFALLDGEIELRKATES
jgi:molybdopterin-containing oxidoreductase family iron-sulfur binding subunit